MLTRYKKEKWVCSCCGIKFESAKDPYECPRCRVGNLKFSLYESNVDHKRNFTENHIEYILALLKVMYIANASDCGVAEPWQFNCDANYHYSAVSKVLINTAGMEAYEYYLETSEWDWAKIRPRGRCAI